MTDPQAIRERLEQALRLEFRQKEGGMTELLDAIMPILTSATAAKDWEIAQLTAEAGASDDVAKELIARKQDAEAKAESYQLSIRTLQAEATALRQERDALKAQLDGARELAAELKADIDAQVDDGRVALRQSSGQPGQEPVSRYCHHCDNWHVGVECAPAPGKQET